MVGLLLENENDLPQDVLSYGSCLQAGIDPGLQAR